MKRVELLAPAGTMEAFEGAVNAGADAVYLAGQRFGARAYADNFSSDELRQVIRTAHLCGVRIHLTVNTLTRQEELQEIPAFLYPLAEEGLDGVIVQDLGVLRLVHREIPELPLHASTQLSVTTADSVRFLASMGVTRVVPARELGISEIRELTEEIPMELETFVHGAMCYCYSGKCLFSSFLGGRSGNRGRCAQTCRLPFTVLGPDGRPIGPDAGRPEYYPLSMRDLCTLPILPQLIEAGIHSFKIEGRMKRPEYAAGVTAVYRRNIDRYYRLKQQHREMEWKVDPEDLGMLEQLYLRTQRSEGYYNCYNGRTLITVGEPGYRGTSEETASAIRKDYIHPPALRKVRMELRLNAGQPAEVSVTPADTYAPVSVTGAVVQPARTSPLRAEDAEKNLRKTGDTAFLAESVICRTDGKSFLPVSQLNSLRREALARLEEQLLNEYNEQRVRENRELREKIQNSRKNYILNRGNTSRIPDGRILAVVCTEEQEAAARRGGADLILDDSQRFALSGTDAFLALPYAVRKRNEQYLERALELLLSGEYRGALVRNLESLTFLRSRGYCGPILSDHSLYCWNREAFAALSSEVQLIILPYELSGRELWQTFGPEDGTETGFHAYGRVPMMISAGCVRKTEKSCLKREEGFCYLRDRRSGLFPVRTICALCQNIIYNSVPLSLHRFTADPLLRRCRLILSFTTETAEQTETVVRCFREADKMGTAAQVPAGMEYTNGHYRKGAV